MSLAHSHVIQLFINLMAIALDVDKEMGFGLMDHFPRFLVRNAQA
jgi:hypothetical protein